ncbi:MAG: cytochrome b5 domain-containing protein [Candidatus Micrarchaeia archaeon]
MCPDGSTVGRIGPNCEFAACPTTPGASPPPAPPAPGNNATPPVPPGSLAPCMAGQAMMQGGCRPAISAAQLATHNTEADCWVGYDGKVYDISQFIPNHKNYRMLIVPLCGSSDQFKAKFEGKHGLSKVSFLESQPLMGALGQ